MDLQHLVAVGLGPACGIAFVIDRSTDSGTEKSSVELAPEPALHEDSEVGVPEVSANCCSLSPLPEEVADILRPDTPIPFLDLPDVVDSLGGASCDPTLLARLGQACTQLQQIVFSTGFIRRRVDELVSQGAEWASGCDTMEQLAVSMAVDEICSRRSRNHIYFPYGGGVQVMPETVHLIDGAAQLACRHLDLTIHVDAHTGAAAPAGVAHSCSSQRAQVILGELHARHVQKDRLSASAWGKLVSSVWDVPETSEAARADMFFRLGEFERPCREKYYSLVSPTRKPEVQAFEVDPRLHARRGLRNSQGLRTAAALGPYYHRIVGRSNWLAAPRGFFVVQPPVRRRDDDDDDGEDSEDTDSDDAGSAGSDWEIVDDEILHGDDD